MIRSSRGDVRGAGILAIAGAACLFLSGAGCSACYVAKQGYHEARILLARRPVEKLVDSKAVEL